MDCQTISRTARSPGVCGFRHGRASSQPDLVWWCPDDGAILAVPGGPDPAAAPAAPAAAPAQSRHTQKPAPCGRRRGRRRGWQPYDRVPPRCCCFSRLGQDKLGGNRSHVVHLLRHRCICVSVNSWCMTHVADLCRALMVIYTLSTIHLVPYSYAEWMTRSPRNRWCIQVQLKLFAIFLRFRISTCIRLV